MELDQSSNAIIPARGGSKRIPRKNIRDFCGKPMIAWVIETAKASELFDDVYVSTDDTEIAEISIRYGAKVPQLRAATLADDYTPITQVVSESIKQFGLASQITCLLYATSAGLTPRHLLEAYKMLQGSSDGQFCMAVTEFSHPPQRRVRLDNGLMQMVEPEFAMTRTQDLEPQYHDAGQFIFGRTDAWLKLRSIWSENTFGYIMPPDTAIDIDTENDWKRAEQQMRSRLPKPPVL